MLMITRSVYGTAMSWAKSHVPPRSASLSTNSSAIASIAAWRVLHGRGLEPVVGDVTMVAVLGAVDVDERLRARCRASGGTRSSASGPSTELRVFQNSVVAPRDLEHVGVPGQRPERRVALRLDPQHRRVPPQLVGDRVPVRLVGVGLGGDEDATALVVDVHAVRCTTTRPIVFRSSMASSAAGRSAKSTSCPTTGRMLPAASRSSEPRRGPPRPPNGA